MPKPDDKIGPYTLISKLGRGAFGVVWLAEKRTVLATTRVALKFPNDEDVDLDAIKQEASLWIHASGHPNVVTFIDADVYDGQVVIVSEYAPDGSLSKWLNTHGGKAPTIDAAVEMVLGILSGLEHLHKQSIIHRDIKPDNILLQHDTPRLADFGIARILKTTSKSTIATGTPAYMSPEAFDGKRNEQTDIWSVGVIFYQLLTGHLPFPQNDIPSLLMAIVSRDPEPLPASIPDPLRRLIGRSLEKDPDERYQTAGEMRRAVRNAIRTSNEIRDEVGGYDAPASIADLPTQIDIGPSPADSSNLPSVHQYVNEREEKEEAERQRREAEEAQREADARRRREEQQRVEQPRGFPVQASPAPVTYPPSSPSTYEPSRPSRKLLWIALSLSAVVVLGVFLMIRLNANRIRSTYGDSSSEATPTPSYSSSTPAQASFPSPTTQPTPASTPQSVSIRMRLLYQGASHYSAGDRIEVTLQSSTQNYSQMTDDRGFVTFSGVPCGEEVEVNFRSDAVDRKLLRVKRFVTCGAGQIDLGIYSATFGERLGSSESDLDGEILN